MSEAHRKLARRPLAMAEALGARLGELHRNGRRPVLVVHAAQPAGPSLLQEISLLTNHEDRQDKRPYLVLLGRPELRGVPRSVNTLATGALFVGGRRRLDAIDGALVNDVAEDQQ